MPAHAAADLARLLARDTEAVCRHYLPQGRREGRYWLIGDVSGTPGRSLFVRLADGGGASAGKWCDAASGEHGDLLDLIAANRRCASLRETLAEARAFLSLPQPAPAALRPRDRVPSGSAAAPARLWAMTAPLPHTLAMRYLRARGLTDGIACASLRFHPHCWYRPDRDDAPHTRTSWPALIAAIRDCTGKLTGVQRTWLDPATGGKAPVATPRRALGQVTGGGVWFGQPDDTMIVGEGIETMLSLRQIMPTLPMVAALSATHLAAFGLPPKVRRLYLARDRDPAGAAGVAALHASATANTVTTLLLDPMLGDFNDDLRCHGRSGLADQLRRQLDPADAARFLAVKR